VSEEEADDDADADCTRLLAVGVGGKQSGFPLCREEGYE